MTCRHIENIFKERYVFDSTPLMYLYGDCARQVERTGSGVQELVSSVNFATPPPQRGLPCKHCHETFANEQGRGIHTRTRHPAANMRQGVRRQRMLGKEDAGRDVLPWDRAGPGRCWHVELDHTTGASSFTLQRKQFRMSTWKAMASRRTTPRRLVALSSAFGMTTGPKPTLPTSCAYYRSQKKNSGTPSSSPPCSTWRHS